MTKGRKKKDRNQINIRLDNETAFIWTNYIKKVGIDGSEEIRKFIKFFFGKDLTLKQNKKKIKTLIGIENSDYSQKQKKLEIKHNIRIEWLRSALEEFRNKEDGGQSE